MSVSILEALMNADYNLNVNRTAFGAEVGKSQLHNAVVLLQKGYGLDEKIEPLLEGYETVEAVPDKLTPQEGV